MTLLIETKFVEVGTGGPKTTVDGECKIDESKISADLLRPGRFLRFGGQTGSALLYVVMVEPGDDTFSKYITAMMSPPIASARNDVYATIPAENISACRSYLKSVGFTLT